MNTQQYTIHNVLQAQHTLEPLVCRFCNSNEVVYNQGIGDARCQHCGKWQLDEDPHQGWTRYQICVTDFDSFGDAVQYEEYAIYDYDLNQEQLAALDQLLQAAANDTPKEAQP